MTQTEALALTLIIEGVSAAAIAPFLSLRSTDSALSGMSASLVTHPILWTIFYPVEAIVGPLTTPLLEMFVFLAEAPVYRYVARTSWDNALLMSLLVNAASWAAGEIMYALA
jgi:hypothetical protein